MALTGFSPDTVLVVVTAAAIPLLLWAAARTPEFTIGFIVFAQILEGFALNTPIASLSPGKVALIIFLGLRLSKIAKSVNSRAYRLGITGLVIYVAGQGLQFLHLDPGSAARQMITASSFAAFAVLGFYVGTRRSFVAAAAIGAAIGLLVLAAFGLAGDLGIGPFPAPSASSRAILGVLIPFGRNLGLDGVLLQFLLPLCVPWLALQMRSPSRLAVRVSSATALGALWIASLLVFQIRTMVLEVPVGLLLTWSLANRKFASGVFIAGASAIVALVLGLSLANSDNGTSLVSTQLRLQSYSASLDIFIRSPSILLFGTDPAQFDATVNATLTYGSQIPANAPIHNLFVEVVLRGGVVSGFGLGLLLIVPLVSMLRSSRRAALFSADEAVAIAGVVIAVIEALVWPGTAKAGPFWMMLGIAVAVAASSLRDRDGSGSTRQGGARQGDRASPAPASMATR